jgi:PAS domain S-box-containing protein
MSDALVVNVATIQRLRESEQWLEAVLRVSSDAVIATDAAGRIKRINPMAEAMTGWVSNDALGRELGEVFCVIHADTGSAAADLTAVLQAADGAPAAHLTLTTRDGSRIPIDHSVTPITDEQDRAAGLVLVFRGASEHSNLVAAIRQRASELSAHAAAQAALNAEMAALTEELRARNEELDAFSHTVAHDLKNPLNVISGFAQLLAEAQTSDDTPAAVCQAEERAGYAIDIMRAAQKMNNIIQELLLLAEVRKVDVPIERLEMDLLVEETVQRLAHMLQDSGAELDAPGHWPAALGYGPWIEEVWTNYLSNAIKYGGHPPAITLGAELLPAEDGSQGTVRFWVHDEGPDIALEDQARLFQPSSRLAKTRAAGHGLGLSIVRRIVAKLGGSVAVESTPGHGATFSFTLPAA